MPCLLFDPSLFSASEMSRRIRTVNVVAMAVLHAVLAAVLVLLGYVVPVPCCTRTALAVAGCVRAMRKMSENTPRDSGSDDQPLSLYFSLILPWFCIAWVVRKPHPAALT